MDDEKIAGLDTDVTEEVITLVSKEGQEFTVGRSAAKISKLIENSLLDKQAQSITLEHIEGPVLAKIAEYIRHHETNIPRPIPKPLQSADMRELVGEWDAEFCETPQDMMFKLLLAANYLAIAPLLEMMCAKVATLMKDKTPQEICSTFNIRPDATPEEEEEIKTKYADLIGT